MLKTTTKGKVALGALITSIIAASAKRQRDFPPGAQPEDDDTMSNSEAGSERDDEMSLSGSERSGDMMSNSSAGSKGSEKGRGKQDVQLQFRAFGVAGQKRTPLQMLKREHKSECTAEPSVTAAKVVGCSCTAQQ